MASAGHLPTWLMPGMVAIGLVAAFAAWSAWDSHQQVRSLEMELVRRQQGAAEQAADARVLAKQAQELARDAAAKVSLFDARLSEVALQRTQLDELIQSLSRSRDENMVADIDAAIRVAMQQSGITGSAEPLVAALRTADERLSRVNQPRLERLRRAVARDLDRVRSAGVPDVGALLIKLDEVVRLVDELPLVAQAAQPGSGVASGAAPRPAVAATRTAKAASATSAPASDADWIDRYAPWLHDLGKPLKSAWTEAKALVRVSRIDRPDAMLVAPEQGYFLRENLKLRLLNARLSLLTRQSETVAADLQSVQSAVVTYFEPNARRTQVALEQLRQVMSQSRQLGVPRPDETLAATAAAVAGR